jgi:hypothetical protein
VNTASIGNILSFGVVLGFAFPYMDASSSTPDQVPQLDLNAAFLETQSQADAERTKKAYAASMKRLQKHSGATRRIFSMDFQERGPESGIVPLTARELLGFLEHLRHQNGKISKSSAQGYKSAVLKFRQLNDFAGFSQEEQVEFKRWFRGLQRQVSSRIRDEDIESSEEGKRHLKFEEYKRICASLLSEGCNLSRFRNAFVHCYVLDFCARADTTVSLHSSLLDWESDSLKVGIAKSKRNYYVVPVYNHVFSNPIQPEICPILSLAFHCCVNKNILNLQSKLFRSNSSENNKVSSVSINHGKH